jgi:YidC/Oxa1 family membrane protein insertase
VAHGLVSDLKGGLGGGLGHVIGQQVAGQTFTPWKYLAQPFHPQHLDTSTKLFEALSHKTTMPFLGIDLSLSPSEALTSFGLTKAIPFFILMALMLVGQIYQNRQIQGRNTNANVNPQQQAIMKFLPFILPVFSFGFPAGLSLYYFTQGLCRIGTQHYITRKYYSDNATASVIDADSRPGSARLEAAKDGAGAKSPAKSAATKSVGKAPEKRQERKPGTSVRSQAAQKKQSGGGKSASKGARSGAASSSGRKSGTARRSGEPRGRGSGRAR